jgi:hypothetical protein
MQVNLTPDRGHGGHGGYGGQRGQCRATNGLVTKFDRRPDTETIESKKYLRLCVKEKTSLKKVLNQNKERF